MQFELLAQSDKCAPAPENSHIVIADVRGSTALISQGRQREVNLVGAACIAAIRNVFPAGQVPYVFGGDGATFLVTEEDLPKCMQELAAVQVMAERNLTIGLRTGSVSLREIRRLNCDVLHGSLKAGNEESIPFLRGNGIALADSLVKQRDGAHNLPQRNPDAVAHVEGLSCRLMPFASQRGSIVSFVIEPRVEDELQSRLLSDIFAALSDGKDLSRFCPIRASEAKHRWFAPLWRSEAAFNRTDGHLSTRIKFFLIFLMRSLVTNYVFVFNKFNGITGLPSRYLAELPEQSDWIKLNGSLYLILDMNPPELEAFTEFLGAQESRGALQFGFHCAPEALLTCHLHSSSHGRHFHFADGSAGGLTAAAKMLKEKKRKADSKTH